MFKVKDLRTGKIVQVLSVECEDNGATFFLIWDNGWKWRPAYNYIPPNYEKKEPEK